MENSNNNVRVLSRISSASGTAAQLPLSPTSSSSSSTSSSSSSSLSLPASSSSSLTQSSSSSLSLSSSLSSSSSSSSSISWSSSSIPYTLPTSSSFNYPALSSVQNIPSYPPPSCPPLPSVSLLNSASGRAFPSSNLGAKITILTSSASSSSSVVASLPAKNVSSTEAPFPTTNPGVFAAEAPIHETSMSGVVVVGTVGRSEDDVSQLLNRLLDAQVFGSQARVNEADCSLFENVQKEIHSLEPDRKSGLDFETSQPNSLNSGLQKEGSMLSRGQISTNKEGEDIDKSADAASKGSKRMDWMRKRLRYYHDEEKGAVYVQFAWGSSAAESMGKGGLNMSMEECEECTLRGLLYMFSVCHLILFLQEGSRVDTHLLRTLRILQNAKHLLVPFVKSHVLSGLHLTSFTLEQSSSSTRSSSHSAGQSSGRGGTSGRNASTIGLMSGSAPSFFPGQCTPVLLFVFLEDFCDANQGSNAFSNGEDKTDLANTQLSTVSCQPGGPIIGSRQAVHLKGSNAVVMLARATNRTEGGLRKKLQSSLESQIRYLVKKCKVLGGLADGVGFGMGSRGPGHSMGSTSGALGGSSLFVLDTMRAACLLDKSPNLQCDALKAAMNVINENLKGKGEAEKINLLDLSGNASEDVQALRDFIWKQVDILRGRGGVLTNSTGGSMGVGMVAAAAAAAAASAAAGGFGGSAGSMKPLSNPPELPSISNWLSACRILLDALLTGEGQQLKDLKKFQPGRVAGSSRRGSAESGNVNIHGKEALGFALGCLSSASDFDLKFSEEWCKRMFPSVVAMYTNSLPPCYPTIIHQSHLEKALHYLKAMVKGPAVDLFAAKLKAECEGIWKPGRQLCDAVSLTGRPCIHKVHDLPSGSITDMDEAKTSKETGRSEGQNELSSSHPKPHSSGVVFLHACACGRSRRLREDPFDFEIANVKFFHFPVCEDLLPSMVIPDCESNKPLGGSAWGLVRLGSSNYYQQSAGLLQTGFSHDKRFLSLWNISYAVEFSKHEVNAISDETTRMNQNLPLYDVPRSLRGTLSFLDVLERRGSKLQSGNVGGVPQGAVEKDERLLAKSALGERRETQMARPSMASDEKRLFKDVVARNASDFPPLQQKRAIQRNVKTVIEKKFHDESEQVLAGIKEIKELSLKDKEQISLGTGAVKAAAFGEREFGKIGIKNLSVYVGLEHECPRGHRFLVSADQIEALGSIGLSEENLTVSQNKVRGAMDNLRKTRHGQEFPVNSSCTWVNQEQASNHLGNAQWNMSSSDGVLCKIVNEGSGDGYRLLNMNIPIYMMCPCCAKSTDKKKKNAPNFAGNISQLQRIFLVTPPLPLLISTCPSVQFNEACDNHIDLKGGVGSTIFSLGCDVVLPPESFVVLRLPFVYYMEHIDGSKYPLNCNKQQPEKTAWLLKSTAFKIMSRS